MIKLNVWLKRAGYFLLSFWLLIACQMAQAATFPAPPQPFRYVNDYAQMLSANQQQLLEQKLIAYGQATSSQIAVVIVPTVGEEEISDYAFQLGDKWGIGRKQLNNGVLLLIAKEDRKLFIAVGQGLQGVLPDALASQIIRKHITPYFKNGQFADGINSGLDYIIAATQGEYGAAQVEQENAGDDYIPAIIFLLFALIVVVAEWRSRRTPYISRRNPNSAASILRDAAIISALNSRRGGRDDDHFGGFGGFGGGSGGGFGGGGFDGGGAGGDW